MKSCGMICYLFAQNVLTLLPTNISDQNSNNVSCSRDGSWWWMWWWKRWWKNDEINQRLEAHQHLHKHKHKHKHNISTNQTVGMLWCALRTPYYHATCSKRVNLSSLCHIIRTHHCISTVITFSNTKFCLGSWSSLSKCQPQSLFASNMATLWPSNVHLPNFYT